MPRLLLVAGLIVGAGLAAWRYLPTPAPATWTAEEVALIKSLSLSQLPALPADPSNRVADSEVAARLGQHLYFDTRLSGTGTVSCATCHQPDRLFTDGRPLAMGTGIGPRHTPSLVGLAYSPWLYWDGRKDSLWAQALAPLEAGHEHAIDRLRSARLVTSDPLLSRLYRLTFGTPPALPGRPVSAGPLGSEAQRSAWHELPETTRRRINEIFANTGKALAAYQRKLLPGRSRFDDYADRLNATNNATASELLAAAEVAGLRLFIGKAQCVTCHNGPLLTNFEFHNTGVLAVTGQLPPMGRYDGVRKARKDPFNCLGDYSDAAPEQCLELRFARDDNSLVGALKTPTLRNVSATAPYMHGGQLATLTDAIRHYNEAPVSMLSHNEAKPLGLRPVERRQLEAFLATLTAPLSADTHWLAPPERE